MRPDPHPGNAASLGYADGAIVIADSDRKQVLGAPEPSEVQRGMSRRFAPKMVVLFSESLNLTWQFCE
jgi:hypothetical protein